MNGRTTTQLRADPTLDLTGALADPTRYGIYRSIVGAAGDPVTVAQVAAQFGLHPNVARMHLQKLVDVGLVRSDTRKSQGGGRPARIYSVSDRVTDLQFPPRDYRTLAALALQAVSSTGDSPLDALERAGADFGHEEGRKALIRDNIDPQRSAFEEVLDSLRRTCIDLGLYPHVEGRPDGTVHFEIRNCVFRELSAQFPGMVCQLHTAVLRAMLQEYFPSLRLETQPSTYDRDGSCLFAMRLVPVATAEA